MFNVRRMPYLWQRGHLVWLEGAHCGPLRPLLMQFASVWGAGHKTAERWWAEGCRSLDDVRLRKDLTEQQASSVPFRLCVRGPPFL